MIHMTIQQLSSYLDAQLAPDSMERVGIHLSSCGECSSKFVAIERQADRLAEALGHDPGDLLSERFERMVDERILNGKRAAASRPATVRTLPPLPETPPVTVPRVSAPYSANEPKREEPALSIAGEGMKRTAQVFATSVEGLTKPRRRDGDRFRGWPVAWVAALILVVVVTGAGVVAYRIGLLPSWSDLPKLELLSMPTSGAPGPPAATAAAPPPAEPADWSVAPGEPLPTSPGSPSQPPYPAETTPAPNQAPTSYSAATPPPEQPARSELPAGDEAIESLAAEDGGADSPLPGAATTTLRGDELLSSGSTPVVRRAQEAPAPTGESPAPTPSRALTPAEAARQSSERAAVDPSASSYEAAARAWEGALASLHGDTYQEGRWRIAEARYRAWQMDPEEGQRASRATAAIRAYLIAAPPGEEREQARAWLTVIRESGFRYIESSR